MMVKHLDGPLCFSFCHDNVLLGERGRSPVIDNQNVVRTSSSSGFAGGVDSVWRGDMRASDPPPMAGL